MASNDLKKFKKGGEDDHRIGPHPHYLRQHGRGGAIL
jgi:hypothetical protein